MIARLFTRETLARVIAAALIATSLLLAIPQWASIFAAPGPGTSMVTTAVGGVIVAGVVVAATSWIRATLFSITFFITMCGFWYNVNADALPGDLIGSWKALASTGLLVPATNNFLIVPVVITWLAAWVTTVLFDREVPGAVLVSPLIAAHAGALAYTIGQQPPSGAVTFMFAGCVLALMATASARRPLIDRIDERTDPFVIDLTDSATNDEVQDESDGENTGDDTQDDATESERAAREAWLSSRERLRLRQMAKAVPVVLVLALFATGAQRFLPHDRDEAFDLRDRIQRPLDIVESTTPLAQVKPSLLEPEPREVFTIDVEGLGPDDRVSRVPVAVLDVYDGAVWSSSANFEAIGAEVPLPQQVGALSASNVRQRVQLTENYPFRFLPRLGVISRAEQQNVGWDPRSGSIARLDVGVDDRFFVNDVTLPDRNLPADADIQAAPSVVTYALSQPPVTPDQQPLLEAFLIEATEGSVDQLDQLRRMEELFASEAFGYNVEAPAGHSLAALTAYLTPPSDQLEQADEDNAPILTGASRIGFAEQSASAFAVSARLLEVPSRVVVGYRLGGENELSADNTRVTVNESMIHAWPEVWVNGVGWFPFEPTNTTNDSASQVARTVPVVDAETEDGIIIRQAGVPEPVTIPDGPPLPTELSRTARLLIALAVLPVAYLLLVVLARRVRRWRRRQGDPANQVSGAWREARDRLGELGMTPLHSSSVLDVADDFEETDRSDIADPLYDLAPLVDTALFSPIGPHQSEATAAWSAADDAVRAAASDAGPSARIKAVANPRRVLAR